MNVRLCLAIFLSGCVLCQASSSSAQETGAVAPSTKKPNVLLICVDDLKPTLGCYGDSFARTPNIDRLATRGVRFDYAYCNQAVCAPSRHALMTSLRPQTLGIYDLATNFRISAPNALTLPQHFRDAGYTAEALGKIFHVGHGNDDDAASWDKPLYRSKAKAYANPTVWKKTSDGKNSKGAATESAKVADDVYVDADVAREACLRIESAASSDKPFFIAVGFIRPHLPFTAPQKYWDLYDADKVPMPEVTQPPSLAPEYAPTNSGELRAYSDIPAKGQLDETLTRRLIHGYYAATSFTDAQIGRVLDALDASPAKDNTIIVLWGDHGWHLGDHGQWCKHSNYEQATRIPLIISAPGLAKQAVTQALTETVDIYPTLAELAGLAVPPGLDGSSVAKVVETPTLPARDSVIHVYPRGERFGRAVRTPRYRMVEWKALGHPTSTAEYELYDYVSDPLETKNLAAEMPDVLQELKVILARHPEAKPQVKAVATPNVGKKVDRDALFTKRDHDQDGQLTFDEFMQGQPDPEAAKGRFGKFDKNNDQLLTRQEFVGQ